MNKKIRIKRVTHCGSYKLKEPGQRNATIMLGKLKVKREKLKGNIVTDIEIIGEPFRVPENQISLF